MIKSWLAMLWWEKTIISKEEQFKRPKITDKVRDAVLEQLDKDISIYDGWWIIKEFESKFWEYHEKKYALTFNSGTSALLAMYEWLDLEKWDEIICPTYTFFATVSPLSYMWIKPVFCDCLDDGNIDPSKIENKITNKTKAIVVTHMRWMPCNMDEIKKISQKYWLYLLEDCSHSHWSSYKGIKTGAFWDVAAWSLQGQKIITWWEWGILLTDNKKIYERALLLWHYNKRCKKEIDQDGILGWYATTWFGLKLRAHPLAIAIANEQFSHIDERIKYKNEYAKRIIDVLSHTDFLKFPEYNNKIPSRYALLMQYDEKKANNVPLNVFIKALNAEWLEKVEKPDSIRPIHDFKLFTDPGFALSRIYKDIKWKDVKWKDDKYDDYSNAQYVFKNSFKMPIWVFEEDSKMTDLYIGWFQKVIKNIKECPEIFF